MTVRSIWLTPKNFDSPVAALDATHFSRPRINFYILTLVKIKQKLSMDN